MAMIVASKWAIGQFCTKYYIFSQKILINAGTDYESLSFNLNYNTSKFQILHFCRRTRNVSKLKKKYFNKNVSSIYQIVLYFDITASKNNKKRKYGTLQWIVCFLCISVLLNPYTKPAGIQNKKNQLSDLQIILFCSVTVVKEKQNTNNSIIF